MFISNCSPCSIQCPQVEGCLHHWTCGHDDPQIWRCHLNPVCHSMMMPSNLHMDMEYGHSLCGKECSWIHRCLSGISFCIPMFSLWEVLFGNPLSCSSSSASRVTWTCSRCTWKMVALKGIYVHFCTGSGIWSRRWNLICKECHYHLL